MEIYYKWKYIKNELSVCWLQECRNTKLYVVY